MLKCPSCGLVVRDVEGDADFRKHPAPPVGSLVLCECGAVNRAEATGDALLTMLGARRLVTLTAAEFDALHPDNRRALELSIERFKQAGRFRAGAAELEPCARCGHEQRQHLDPRWPCNMLACGCTGYTRTREEPAL
jgi:hypothetical protein